MTEEEIKTAKISRRTAKAGLTRQGMPKTLEQLISNKRPANGVIDTLLKFTNAFETSIET